MAAILKIEAALLKALGLEGRGVVSLTLHAEVGDLVRVTVELLPTPDQVERVAELLETHRCVDVTTMGDDENFRKFIIAPPLPYPYQEKQTPADEVDE